MMDLRVHAIVGETRANGPGVRACVWVQGCRIHCKGCFNPETHAPEAGSLVPVDEIVAKLIDLGSRISGLTISGGEPLDQPEALKHLLDQVHNRTDLTILISSGYTRAQIEADPAKLAAIEHAGAVICGPYVESQRTARGFRGSLNKEVWIRDSAAFKESDFRDVPRTEVIVAQDGTITLTGVGPMVSRG